MPLPIAALALMAAPAVMSGVQGLMQNRDLKRLKKSDYIPEALKEKYQRDQTLAQVTSQPGEAAAKALVEQGAATTMSRIERSSNNSADVLNAIAATGSQSNNAMQEIAARSEQQKFQAQQNLGNTEMQVAAVQDQNQRDYDQTKAALRESRDQNYYNALTGLAGVAATQVPIDGMASPQDYTGNQRLYGGRRNPYIGTGNPNVTTTTPSVGLRGKKGSLPVGTPDSGIQGLKGGVPAYNYSSAADMSNPLYYKRKKGVGYNPYS